MFQKLGLAVLVVGLCLPGTADAKKRSKRGKFTLDEVTKSEITRVIDTGLRSGNMAIRSSAYRALALSDRPKKEIEAGLKDGLKDPQSIVVAGVVEGMISRGMKGYDQALIKTLGAQDLSWDENIAPLLASLSPKSVNTVLVNGLNAKGLRGKNRIASEALKQSPRDAMSFLAKAQKAGGEAASLALNTLADLSATYAFDLYPLVIRSGSDAAKAVVLGQSDKLPKDMNLKFLAPLLKSKNASVKEGTALLLAPTGNKAAAIALIPRALNESLSVEERLTSLRAIQGAVDRSMLSQLAPLMDPDVDPKLRGAVYGCYGLAGDNSVLGMVNADLVGTDGNARAAASRWLGTLGGTSEVPRLKNLLVDGNTEVRRNAAYSLGEMRTLDMVPLLEQGLRDVSAEVKLETVRALAKVRNNEVAEIVQFLAFDRDVRVRRETVQILAEARHIATLSTLENLLNDSDMDLRFEALMAVMNTDLERGKTSFKRSLLWLSPEQLQEIARRQGKNYVTFASLALESRREDIREAALKGLRALDKGTANAMLLSFKDSTRYADVRHASYMAYAQQNWAEALPVFEGWLTSVETSPSDLELAFSALEEAKPSQRVLDALKAGFVLNETFQARATLSMLKLLKGK